MWLVIKNNHNIQLASHDTCRDVRNGKRQNNIPGNIEAELIERVRK